MDAAGLILVSKSAELNAAGVESLVDGGESVSVDVARGSQSVSNRSEVVPHSEAMLITSLRVVPRSGDRDGMGDGLSATQSGCPAGSVFRAVR